MAQPKKKLDKQLIKLPKSLKDAFIDDDIGLDYDWRDRKAKNLSRTNKIFKDVFEYRR